MTTRHADPPLAHDEDLVLRRIGGLLVDVVPGGHRFVGEKMTTKLVCERAGLRLISLRGRLGVPVHHVALGRVELLDSEPESARSLDLKRSGNGDGNERITATGTIAQDAPTPLSRSDT